MHGQILGAAYWDKYAIAIIKENKETAKEASPEWLSAILKEAQVPDLKEVNITSTP